MLLLGVHWPLTPHLSFHLDAAYVHYRNVPVDHDQGLDLSFGGLLVRPMVEMRL